jgi:hypothetical protein
MFFPSLYFKRNFQIGNLSFGISNLMNENQLLPTRNFQESYFHAADRVSGEEMARTILKQRKGCYACPVACGRVTEVNGSKGEGPEYETIWAFGPACGIDDIKVIARANYLCNDLGLDTISTGSTIACAIELSVRGFLEERFRFGEPELLEDLVKKIGYRQGIGNELAEGSYRFASRYGHPEISMTVKRQEIPGYDPRNLQGQGLEYATSVRGACHVYGNMVYPEVFGIPIKLEPSSIDEKPYWTKRFQDLTAAIDSLGMCLFTYRALSPRDYATIASNITGSIIEERGFFLIGERIWNIQKLFNLSSGLTKDEIRELSRELGLPTWDKPSFACLSSRIPFGEQITIEKLKQVDAAEQYLRTFGVKQVRVRHHGEIARIEIDRASLSKLIDDGNASHLTDANGGDSAYAGVTPYLDLGGSVWVWALSPFGCYYNATSAALQSLAQRPIPMRYFDIVGEFAIYGGSGFHLGSSPFHYGEPVLLYRSFISRLTIQNYYRLFGI